MANRKRSSVQKYHDRVAGRYDASYEDDFWLWHDALTWDYLKPFLPQAASARVIDLGCGTGKWGARIAKSGFHVTFVDISGKMLDQARRKLEETVPAAKVDFVQADLCELEALPLESYALAVAMGDPIGCSSSPSKAMKQIRKRMTSAGVLVASLDNRLAALDFHLAGGHAEEVARFLRDGRTHWLTKDKEEQFPIHTFTPNGIRALVTEAGYDLLDLVGKTVLPLRHHRELLKTSDNRRTWARIEKKLCRDADAIGRASHIQFACRVRRSGVVSQRC